MFVGFLNKEITAYFIESAVNKAWWQHTEC